jgi:hypothetical protein
MAAGVIWILLLVAACSHSVLNADERRWCV